MATSRQYKKISGRSGFIISHRAYLAEDYLLSVRTSVFQDYYSRFFFRDLEAFSIHRTSRYAWMNLVSGAMLLISLALVLSFWPRQSGDPHAGVVFWGIVGFVALVGLVSNLFLGATCKSFVRTAVQTVELPSMNRWRGAMKVREIIRERAIAMQPAITDSSFEQEGPDGPIGLTRVAPRSSKEGGPVATGEENPPGTERAGHAVGVTALGAFFAAAMILWDYLEIEGWAFAANLFGVLVAVSAAVAQLVMGRGKKPVAWTRAVAICVFGAVVLGGLAGYVAIVAAVVARGVEAPTTEYGIYLSLGGYRPGESMVVDICYLIVVGTFVLTGCFGFLVWARMLVRNRNKVRASRNG